MPRTSLVWARGLLAAVTLLQLGCAAGGSVTRESYRRGRLAYRVGPLPAEWQPWHVKGAHLVFHHRAGGTIAASGQCPAGDDVPLAVLTSHLLFGIETRQELGRDLFTLDGRQALRTRLLGELDGVPVALELVVLKKDGCVYDLQLIAAPSELAARQRDFAALVQGFATIPGR